jgi:hypothetical protein
VFPKVLNNVVDAVRVAEALESAQEREFLLSFFCGRDPRPPPVESRLHAIEFVVIDKNTVAIPMRKHPTKDIEQLGIGECKKRIEGHVPVRSHPARLRTFQIKF